MNESQPQIIDIPAGDHTDAMRREATLGQLIDQPVKIAWILLAANILIWAAGFITGNTLGIHSSAVNNEQLALYTGMKVNRLINAGQWWRVISCQYVHLSIMHIVFNGYGLYVVGPLVEKFYGRKRFFVTYMVAGTVGGVASYLFTSLPSGGASG